MSATLRYKVGDWVAVPMPGAEGGRKPGKVAAATRERVTVNVRIDGTGRPLTFEGDAIARLARIRWRRQRGRARWEIAR